MSRRTLPKVVGRESSEAENAALLEAWHPRYGQQETADKRLGSLGIYQSGVLTLAMSRSQGCRLFVHKLTPDVGWYD